MNNYLILDDVPANNTIWVLGDCILTEAAGHYNYFKKLKDSNGPESISKQLYMETMYAIRIIPPGLYTHKQARNIPNLILNSLVDTLNTKAKVPHTLVIMMNDYRFWNDMNILTHQMDRLIFRFLKEIRRIVESRNLSLPPRAVNWDYPRIFLTRALPLPNNMSTPYPKGFKANRRKFNRLLLKFEEDLNYKSINMPDFACENENQFFTENGGITQKGYRNIWSTISDAIHKSDNQTRINLNKAKAKQLSAQITVTKSEMRDINDPFKDESDISDIEYIDDHQEPKIKSTKRALLQEFDSSDTTKQVVKCKPKQNYYHSPSSTVSEYFTVDNSTSRQPDHPRDHSRFYHKPRNDHYHHKPYNRKKRLHKRPSNWRNQPQNWQ